MPKITKKIKILIVFLIFSTNYVNAQYKTQYQQGFEKGFISGYCQNQNKIYCSTPVFTPLAPMPRINESSQNYSNGYDRGFQMGSDLFRFNQIKESEIVLINPPKPNFNGYVSQNPVEAMAAVGIYKQKLYDSRKGWIKNRILGLQNLSITLFNSNNITCTSCDWNTIRNNLWDKVSAYYKSYGLSAADFADNNQFNSIVNKFNELERMFYTAFNVYMSTPSTNTNPDPYFIASPARKSISNRQKSFLLAEIGYNLPNGSTKSHRASLNVINNWPLSSYLSMGLGAGVRNNFSDKPVVPIFVNFRANLTKSNFIPYISFNAGSTFKFQDQNRGGGVIPLGLLLNSTLGFSFKLSDGLRINTGASYEHLEKAYRSTSTIYTVLGFQF